MAKQLHVEGHEKFIETCKEHADKSIFALFCGSTDSSGNSWCPDCVTAEPVVKDCMSSLPEGAVFIHCSVGGRDFWKDKSNIFRTDDKLKLKSVPTLMRLGQPKRLEEEQCANKELVQMLFEEED